jgi:hypothetical protein
MGYEQYQVERASQLQRFPAVPAVDSSAWRSPLWTTLSDYSSTRYAFVNSPQFDQRRAVPLRPSVTENSRRLSNEIRECRYSVIPKIQTHNWKIQFYHPVLVRHRQGIEEPLSRIVTLNQGRVDGSCVRALADA